MTPGPLPLPWLSWTDADGYISPFHYVDGGRVGLCGEPLPLDAKHATSVREPAHRAECCGACLTLMEFSADEIPTRIAA